MMFDDEVEATSEVSEEVAEEVVEETPAVEAE